VPAEVNRGDVELPEIPHTDHAVALEAFVADPCAGYPDPAICVLEKSRRLADKGKTTDALQTKAAKLESAAGREETVISAIARKSGLTVIR
jgi:hypothetical protein